MKKHEHYWEIRELILIGVFASASKIITLVVTLLSGGMNPIGLIAKNLIFTSLLIIMLYKIQKLGTLLIFILVTTIVSLLFLGGSIMLIPSMFIAALLAEAFAYSLGGYKRNIIILLTVFLYDILSKAISIGISWIILRENPSLLALIVPIIIIGYIGSCLGIPAGIYSVKELRHAGIIQR
ncbi:MAG: MptD family putative ECF transporter S component [Desulfovibrionaceae bacterium]